VEQILLRLRRAELVDSRRGARGGYVLAREAAEISVQDVLEATEHRTFEVNCEVRPIDVERCGGQGECSVRPVWLELRHRVDSFLGSVSLADLARPEAQVRELVHQ
jgi:Rrf2 family iron-sulfur cluster assembly transcriptional regulator